MLNYFVLPLLPVLLLPMSPIDNTPSSEQPVYSLPDNPKEPVIVLDFRGGYTPPRTSDEPAMSILANGTVVIPKRFAQERAYRGKLSRDELQSLLHFIIDKHDFFKYDAQAVQNKIQGKRRRIAAAGGGIPRLADAATVMIRVHANGKTNEATYYPSGVNESNITELAHRAAIQKRLLHIKSVIQVGGHEEVAKWLAVVNKRLKEQYPKAEPLTSEHFQTGTQRANGSMFVRFFRWKLDDTGKTIPGYFTQAMVTQQPGTPPKVVVTYKTP